MKNKGFTLAEVLITLVIIGVVAAITIPTLMNNTNEQEYKSALKKAISATNQALTLHYSLEGLTAQDYTTNEELVNNVFKKRMNIIESTEPIEFTNGCTNGSVFTTTDGTMYCVSEDYFVDTNDTPTSECNYLNTIACIENGEGANLWIDVNGAKNPNRLTLNSSHPRDIYTAQIYSQRVVPFGYPTQEVMYDKKVSTNTSDEESSTPTEPSNPDTPNIEPETPTEPDVTNPENEPNLEEEEQQLKEEEEKLKEEEQKLKDEAEQQKKEKEELLNEKQELQDELNRLKAEEDRLELEEERLELEEELLKQQRKEVKDELKKAELDKEIAKLKDELKNIQNDLKQNLKDQDVIDKLDDKNEEQQEKIEDKLEKIDEDIKDINKAQKETEEALKENQEAQENLKNQNEQNEQKK